MDNSIEQTARMLHDKYGKSVLTKQECADELGIALSTMTLRIQKGYNIPEYIKDRNGPPNASVTFPIMEIAKYLCRTTKVV